MAATASPYGLVPHSMAGGAPYSGAFDMIPITSAYGTRISNGDPVQIVAAGTIEKVTTVGTNASPWPVNTIGVFVGCTYTDTNLGFISSNVWPASQAVVSGTTPMAHVVTDPNVIFRIQADDALAQTELGMNYAINVSTSTATSGKSNASLDVATAAVTNTLALKVVGFYAVEGFSAIGDAKTDALVKINPLSHAYTGGTGL